MWHYVHWRTTATVFREELKLSDNPRPCPFCKREMTLDPAKGFLSCEADGYTIALEQYEVAWDLWGKSSKRQVDLNTLMSNLHLDTDVVRKILDEEDDSEHQQQ